MTRPTELQPETCNCSALRQAARHITQLYDHFLVPTGLRATQFSILANIKSRGPLTINALAEAMVMDRTTLGRNIQPLVRDGLIAVKQGRADRRSKELHLTAAGTRRLQAAAKGWAKAQKTFESAFGRGRAADLRALLRAVATSDPAPSVGDEGGKIGAARSGQ